ncbi:MAG: hypothetical protein ABSA53_39750 [Streptosporangiaceae bacterium]
MRPARASCSPRRAGTSSPRTSFEVIARYVEALGGRLDLVADFGDRTVRLPVSDTATAA